MKRRWAPPNDVEEDMSVLQSISLYESVFADRCCSSTKQYIEGRRNTKSNRQTEREEMADSKTALLEVCARECCERRKLRKPKAPKPKRG
uniref:Uncharacterized protein MANES_05G205400 n=1 Tax=Rhizophora mucronata TaxID=61149 RepID=A0A2P2J8S4_RHIMU